MPIYEYECRSCGKRTELLQRMDDPPLAACPACGGEVRKLISAPAVQFKGSGWYVTDYAGKGSAGKKPETSEGSGSSESKSETKSEAKTETKSETKKETASSGSSGTE